MDNDLYQNEINYLINEISLVNTSLDKYNGKKRYKFKKKNLTREELSTYKNELEEMIKVMETYKNTENTF
jgi:hypothetical protein